MLGGVAVHINDKAFVAIELLVTEQVVHQIEHLDYVVFPLAREF